LKQHHVNGFSLSETSYLPGSTLPRHSHESHYVCFVLNGTYKESYERKTRTCQAATVVYHPAGEMHAQYFDNSAVDLFRIEVDPTRLRDADDSDLRLRGLEFQGGLAVGLANRLYREFREPDAMSYLAIEGLALELIAEIARDSRREGNVSSQPPQWLRQAHELIKSRFIEHLSLGDIAQTVGVHPVTPAREFRNHYGCTIGQMVRRERISFACRKLLRSREPFAEIALAAGFCDQGHFAKTFKKLTGITPTQYRSGFRLH
jgi:AraC family transcriptional regulator